MVTSTTLDPLLGQVAGSSAAFPVASGGRAFAYAEFSPQVTSTSGYVNGPGSNESVGGQGERHRYFNTFGVYRHLRGGGGPWSNESVGGQGERHRHLNTFGALGVYRQALGGFGDRRAVTGILWSVIV